jgi:hypothetical protein
LRGLSNTQLMNARLVIDIDDLLTEIGRYLAAVDVFRSVDCEPTWRPERRREHDAEPDEAATSTRIAR